MSIQRVKEQHKIVIFQVKSRRRGKTLNWSPTGEGCIVAERLPMSTLPTPRGCHQLMITPPGEESLATSLKRSQNADFLPCRGGLKRYNRVSLQPSPTPRSPCSVYSATMASKNRGGHCPTPLPPDQPLTWLLTGPHFSAWQVKLRFRAQGHKESAKTNTRYESKKEPTECSSSRSSSGTEPRNWYS